jgi:hypothetical protein|tara:strand:- start:1389 stop:1553 length:165 start_codon:yes stop_codon:yes gene_type:complete
MAKLPQKTLLLINHQVRTEKNKRLRAKHLEKVKRARKIRKSRRGLKRTRSRWNS